MKLLFTCITYHTMQLILFVLCFCNTLLLRTLLILAYIYSNNVVSGFGFAISFVWYYFLCFTLYYLFMRCMNFSGFKSIAMFPIIVHVAFALLI